MWYMASVVQVFPLVLVRVFLSPKFICQFAFGCLFIFEVFVQGFFGATYFLLLFLGFVHLIDFLDLKGLEST